MARIKIPERYITGFAAILSLSDEITNELVSALVDVPPTILPKSLSEAIAQKVNVLSSDELTSIIETLLSLYYSKLHHEDTPEEMTENLWQGIEGTDIKSLDSVFKDKEEFKTLFSTRLIKLLTIESLDRLSKALFVLRSNEKIFHEARIITDIRPVFGPDPRGVPTAAVIVHMLNITYHHDNGMKELYIALDTGDLKKLRDVIDRADLKANSIKDLLNAAKVTNITVD